MFSTCLEIAGFAAFVVATFLLGGVAAALYVAGGELLLVGVALGRE